MSVEWKDLAELQAHTVRLDAAASVALDDARAVVAKGCLNIKNDARDIVRPHATGHARRYPYSIGYDTWVLGQAAVGEVGPDKDKKGTQAGLGSLLEYGSVNNSPHPHFAPAADREIPRFEKSLLDLAEHRVVGR